MQPVAKEILLLSPNRYRNSFLGFSVTSHTTTSRGITADFWNKSIICKVEQRLHILQVYVHLCLWVIWCIVVMRVCFRDGSSSFVVAFQHKMRFAGKYAILLL